MSETPGDFPSTEPDPDGAHVAAIEVEAEPGETEGAAPGANGAPAPGAVPVGPDGLITADVFAEGFKIAFSVAGDLTGLETLKRAPEQATADPAAAALYETCREVPWLHWLLRPEGKWLQRVIVLGAFAVPVYAGCRAELAARGAAKAPDNDNPDPGAGGSHQAGEARDGDVIAA